MLRKYGKFLLVDIRHYYCYREATVYDVIYIRIYVYIIALATI